MNYRNRFRGNVDTEVSSKETGWVRDLEILREARNDLWNIFENNELGDICRKYNKDILPDNSIIDKIKRIFKK